MTAGCTVLADNVRGQDLPEFTMRTPLLTHVAELLEQWQTNWDVGVDCLRTIKMPVQTNYDKPAPSRPSQEVKHIYAMVSLSSGTHCSWTYSCFLDESSHGMHVRRCRQAP